MDKGYIGKAEELTLPKLAIKTEEWRAGGMDAPVEIDMGMEKLECSFTLGEYDADLLKLFGLSDANAIRLKFTGSIEDEMGGAVTPVEVLINGRLRELDPGSWKAGDNATLKATVATAYYKLSIDNQEIHEIDVPNMVRKIDGVDLLEGRRKALQIN